MNFAKRQAIEVWPILTLALVVCGCDEHAVEKAHLPYVYVKAIHFEDSVEQRSFPATIAPRIIANEAFQTTGRVTARLFEVGDRVTTGQVLATLDQTDFILQKEQAEAEYSAASIAAEIASADAKRGDILKGSGWNSQAAFDRQRASAAEAQARMQRAKKSEQLAVRSLAYTSLIANTSGVVLSNSLELGQVVMAGQVVVSLAKEEKKEALVALPESLTFDAGAEPVTVELWSNAGKVYKAILREIDPMSDPNTRTFNARFAIVDADNSVRYGMSATLHLEIRAKHVEAKVPSTAIYDRGKGASLWVVGLANKLELKPVEIDGYDKDEALVSRGVSEGEKFVVFGVQKLDENQAVQSVDSSSF